MQKRKIVRNGHKNNQINSPILIPEWHVDYIKNVQINQLHQDAE